MLEQKRDYAMNQEEELQLYQRAFRQQSEGKPKHTPTADRSECPDDEQIFQAASGALSVKQRRKLVDHTVACADCAESWRFARMLDQLSQQNPHGSGEVAPAKAQGGKLIRLHWGGAAALAAAVVLVLGLSWFQPLQRDTPSTPVMRSATAGKITSAVADQTLTPQACQLAWQLKPLSAEVTYDVKVTSDNVFNVLFQTSNLAATQVTVPAAALAGLPQGSHLLWQVTAIYPDGSSVSASFVNPIGE